MADYYPVLARAVSRLPDNNVQARQEIYKHARTIADAQLLGQDLQRPAAQIVRERAALEAAIERVETDFRFISSHSSAGEATIKSQTMNATNNMGRIPESLAKMLFRLTFIVGMMAFIGLISIRGLVLVSQRVIGYPVLLVAITLMVGLFIFISRAIFREARVVSSVDLTGSALRSGF